jgi:hypothetical protein
MFNRNLFKGGLPRLTPPASLQTDILRKTISLVKEKGLDAVTHKQPHGKIFCFLIFIN